MALTLETHTTKSLSLDEYIDHVATTVEVEDTDSVLASAEALRALANNRRFLTERLNQEIRQWRSFQTSNAYTPQTLMLGGGRGWFIRANVWTPLSEAPVLRDWERSMYVHLRPHDHNFSFMTVGYFGNGYKTSIYEYDPEGLIGIAGERVNLRFLEDTSLPQGKVMFYRASRDVHGQAPPEDFSISLNLMLCQERTLLEDQYYFDVEQNRVEAIVRNGGVGRLMMCHIARHIGDGTTTNLLEELVVRHPSARVRAVSTESLAELAPTDAARIWERAMQDEHGYVRQSAETALRRLASGG
jgi:hypothetical protein